MFLIPLAMKNEHLTHGFHRSQILFKAGTKDYHIYRIPSMVSTQKGTLLTFAAARKGSGGDWDPMDIVMRRSTDSDKTWDPLTLLVHHDSLTCDNAMPIVDFNSNEVHLLHQVDYARCYYMKSLNDGLTWSNPVDITETVDEFKKIYPWTVMAPGPGHGIQLMNGRLVVPFWLSDGSGKEFGPEHRGHRPSIVVSVYSDDHGKTWKAGEMAVPDNDTTVIPNETSCIQLADGKILFNSRNESFNYQRLFTYSDNGATKWSTPVFSEAFFEPICFGSMCRFSIMPFQSKNRILFCNPDSRHDPWMAKNPATPRSANTRRWINLTIHMVTPDGIIHVFYEGGTTSATESHFQNAHLSIVSFDLKWLTDGKDELIRKEIPLKWHAAKTAPGFQDCSG
jgi:sialidase-1